MLSSQWWWRPGSMGATAVDYKLQQLQHWRNEQSVIEIQTLWYTRFVMPMIHSTYVERQLSLLQNLQRTCLLAPFAQRAEYCLALLPHKLGHQWSAGHLWWMFELFWLLWQSALGSSYMAPCPQSGFLIWSMPTYNGNFMLWKPHSSASQIWSVNTTEITRAD